MLVLLGACVIDEIDVSEPRVFVRKNTGKARCRSYYQSVG